ncbi:MAG: glycosyltransferase [Pirellulales bacterium]
MTPSAPRVSVIIPTYNRAETLIEAVESVLAQSFRDYEIVVADDGSTDDTAARLAPYLDRLCYDTAPNRGQSAARNRAARSARGEILAFLDSDDLWTPDRLAAQLPLFDDAALGWSYCDMDYFGDERSSSRPSSFHKTPPHRGRILKSLIVDGCPMHTPTLMVRKELFFAVGGYDEALRVFEDHDLYYRLAAASPVDYVDRALVHCRRDNRPAVRVPAERVELRAEIKRRVFAAHPDARAEFAVDEFRVGYLNSLLDAAAEYWVEGRNADADRLIAEARAARSELAQTEVLCIGRVVAAVVHVVAGAAVSDLAAAAGFSANAPRISLSISSSSPRKKPFHTPMILPFLSRSSVNGISRDLTVAKIRSSLVCGMSRHVGIFVPWFSKKSRVLRRTSSESS